VAVNFERINDKHITGLSIGDMGLVGVPISSVTIDIDGQPRYSIPYIGCDEVTAAPLPVVLTYFNAVKDKADIQLRWASSFDRIHHHFEVERSTDNVNFVSIGKVKIKRKHKSSTMYTYVDKGAKSLGQGTVYYRLKQYDRDGNSSLSSTINVAYADDMYSVKIYPNPFTGPLNIDANVNDNDSMRIRISNTEGVPVYEKSLPVVKGSNLFNILETQTLTEGIYTVTTDLKGNISSNKVIKIKSDTLGGFKF
jgi:hypothetical protein